MIQSPRKEDHHHGMQSCDTCFDLDHTSTRWNVDVKDNLTIEYSLSFESSQLALAAEQGCAICSLIRNGLELMSRKLFLFDQLRPYRGRFILQTDCPVEVEVVDESRMDLSAKPSARIQYYTHEGNRDPQWAAFGTAKDVPSEISVERCSSIILKWIANCRENHQACAVERPEVKTTPSRMLDIEPREDASVVLVESRDDACHTYHYATLSHCWGKAHVIQTTKQTLTQRKRCIEWQSLPQTFQDAIIIVRAVNIRYIWIDSLCIIQDDELDWKRESACMASIYSNSYLNIAATGASDSRGGCLYPRSLKHASQTFDIRSFPVNTNSGHSQPPIFVRPSFEPIHHRYSTHSSYSSGPLDTKVTPLLSRAWVFQERYLAPRTLHFHPSEMIMECKSNLCCECTGLNNIVSRSRRNSLDLKFLDARKVLDNWFEVVEEFSRLYLTRESDRLMALIGVATVFQARLQSGYLAGLWREDIARGILWDVTRYENLRPRQNIRRHQHLIAPSWSWASLILDADGVGIIFPTDHDETFNVDQRFEFLGTDIPFPATESSYGATNGAILVRGAFVTAIACYYNQSGPGAKEMRLVFCQDLDDIVLVTAIGMYIDVASNTGDASPGDAIVFCLLVGAMVEDDWDSNHHLTYFCTLVLKPSLLVSDSYERIGVLDIKEDRKIFEEALEMTFKLI